MPGIDESLEFHPLRIAVLTVSDAEQETDSSGAFGERLVASGTSSLRAGSEGRYRSDQGLVREWAAHDGIDIVLTTGGTGFMPRDVTPEAIRPLLRREMEGFSILFHQASQGIVGLSTLQSRAFAGQVEDIFVFCLPGSTGACRDGWDLILSLELDSRYRPCSIAGLVPRLRELCR